MEPGFCISNKPLVMGKLLVLLIEAKTIFGFATFLPSIVQPE